MPIKEGVPACPSREVWLCAHPAGMTVCPSRRCDCASIQGDDCPSREVRLCPHQAGITVCQSRGMTVHPGGCDWVHIQEGVPVCPYRGV